MSFPTPVELFTTVTRKRKTAGSFVSGTWTPGAPAADVVVKANVQPARPEDLLKLPEGFRTRAAILVITDADLRTGNEATQVEPDRVVWASEEWQILHVEDYGIGPLTHKECIATRLDREGV